MQVVDPTDGPTAVVAHNDTVAIEQLDRLYRDGLTVPRDVSVTGYDDIALAAHALIGLTTVATDPEQAGASAAEQLMQAIREHRHVRHRSAQAGRLVVRSTTGRAARRRRRG
jgi:LacI family transcriptional regulator